MPTLGEIGARPVPQWPADWTSLGAVGARPGRDMIVAPPYRAPGQDSAAAQIAGSVIGGMARGVYNAVTLPGDVYGGRIDPTSDEALQRANDLAGVMTGTPRGGATLGSGVVKPEGIRAYHGSPHDFDKFDISKIGTGEGAQAYGHGLYMAENEGVARQYRDQLAASVGNTQTPVGSAQRALGAAGGNVEQAIASLEENAKHLPARVQEYQDAIAILKKGDFDPRAGRMYEVNIGAHPDQFLDWDRPLSEQGGPVQNAVDRLTAQSPSKEWLDWRGKQGVTGNEFYDAVLRDARTGRSDQVATSNALRDAGIPGLKYLDAGSRRSIELQKIVDQSISADRVRLAKEELARLDLTRNYVVFDDKLIDILRKYGLAGMAAPSALGAGLYDPAQQQTEAPR